MSDAQNPPSTANVTNKQDTADVLRRLAAEAASAEPLFASGKAVPGIESWVLERKLGGGGFGEVWLARHAWNVREKPRAVKFCTDLAARHRLVTHEKNVVLRVMKYAGDHPNVVPLLDCNLSGDIPWLMYEFVEGGTLAGAIEQWRRLPLPERLTRAAKTLHAIAGALGTFHRLAPPLVHRDLKPQNVLMACSVPRITDFGIGGVAVQPSANDTAEVGTAAAARVPTALHTAGTRLYSPPEQMLGATPNPRDDVYALGIIAYQMVFGDIKAVPGPDAADELRELGVPDALASLTVKSVALNPDRRPKDGTAWEATVADWLQREKAAKSPATASLAPTPKAIEQEETRHLSVPGKWFSRPMSAAHSRWLRNATTPGEITISPDETCRFVVSQVITDEQLVGLVPLNNLTTLHSLDLGDCRQITNAGLVYLRGLTTLQSLDLYSCHKITDAGLTYLQELINLEELNLGGCEQITDAGVSHLKPLTALRILSLPRCARLTDAGVAHLKAFPNLKTLSLSQCAQLTDASISHLKALTALQTLILSMCKQITDAGVAVLRESLPNCKVIR